MGINAHLNNDIYE